MLVAFLILHALQVLCKAINNRWQGWVLFFLLAQLFFYMMGCETIIGDDGVLVSVMLCLAQEVIYRDPWQYTCNILGIVYTIAGLFIFKFLRVVCN